MSKNEIVLNMKNITKDFPGVRALNKVNFDLRKGEVHALVGENGAGKSTLMSILGGVHTDYQGQIFMDKRLLRFSNPREAITQGIGIIYQELDLVQDFSIGENIFLGHEPTVRKLGIFGFINRRRIFAETKKILTDLGFNIQPKAKVGSLSVGDQQLAQIAKAIRFSAKVLVMDEPTARLAYHETEALFRNIKTLKQKGISIIYISHHIEEVMKVADRVTVLRDGRVVSTVEKRSTSLPKIIRMVVGRELADGIKRPKITKGDEVLSVEGLSRRGVFKNVNFSLRKGEILGLGGLVGAGRTEVVRCIFGADKLTGGKIYVQGRLVKITSPLSAIEEGIVLVPEERKTQGIIPMHSVSANLSLAILRLISKFQFIKLRQRKRISKEMINVLAIKTPSLEQEVQLLSGGNQQKVVIGKWLSIKPKIIILDQPTRGIDVKGKQEIYNIITDLAREGSAIVLITDELSELIGLADHIIVMRMGRMTEEFTRGEVNQEQLLAAILGT